MTVPPHLFLVWFEKKCKARCFLRQPALWSGSNKSPVLLHLTKGACFRGSLFGGTDLGLLCACLSRALPLLELTHGQLWQANKTHILSVAGPEGFINLFFLLPHIIYNKTPLHICRFKRKKREVEKVFACISNQTRQFLLTFIFILCRKNGHRGVFFFCFVLPYC